jgi:hypothetical protein
MSSPPVFLRTTHTSEARLGSAAASRQVRSERRRRPPCNGEKSLHGGTKARETSRVSVAGPLPCGPAASPVEDCPMGDVHDRYGPEARYAVEAEAELPNTAWDQEVARGLELGLPGSDSIVDKRIPTSRAGNSRTSLGSTPSSKHCTSKMCGGAEDMTSRCSVRRSTAVPPTGPEPGSGRRASARSPHCTGRTASSSGWTCGSRSVLDKLGSQGLIDWSRSILDGACVRAKKVPLCLLSSSSGCGPVEGAVAEHGEQDVDSAAG